MKYCISGSLLVAGLLAFTLSGCGTASTGPDQPASTGTPAANSEQSDQDHADHAGHDHGDNMEHGDHEGGGQASSMEEMEKGLASLSPEDAASARKQHVCPVTGEMLGTMGTPIKVEVKGQQVWLCCPDCKDKLLADPDKYLAKLNH